MNDFLKNTWTFWGLMIFAVGITLLVFVPTSAEEQTTIIQEPLDLSTSETDDQIGKLIMVKLHDGVSSGDDLK